MRIIVFLFIAFFIGQPVIIFSQTPEGVRQQMTQAINDLKKQIADQEKKITEAKKNNEDNDAIKKMEDKLVQLKQQLSMMEGAGKSITSIPASIMNKASDQVIVENDQTPGIIPPKNTALLNSLPKDNLSKTELITFLNTLNNDLRKKIQPERVADVQKIIGQLNNDALQIAYSGVAAWYSNSPAQAALLMAYSAMKNPSDANTLNNCGAILNLCGHGEKAIPILEYVLVSHPDNSTVLNNLGQAYAGLGDTTKAMMYFMRCIKASPNHPEANATAAIIEEANGNIAQAMAYTEQSLKGAYSEVRENFYNNNKKSCKVNVLFNTQHFSKIKFFDAGSLRIPQNCRDWANCETVYPEQQAYFEMIKSLTRKFESIVGSNQVSMAEIKKMGVSPFNKAASFKKRVLGDCYMDRKFELADELLEKTNRLTEQKLAEQIAMEERFTAELKACPINDRSACVDKTVYKHCKERKAFDSKYFGLLADISEDHTIKSYTEDVGYYNSLVYLEAIGSSSEKVLASKCGAYAVGFIGGFNTYILSTGCNPASKPDCEQYNPANQQNPNSPDFKDPQCPINLKIPFGAGKVSLSCEKFGIEVGQGIKFGYEKNFITKESTLSMGVGIDVDIPGILDAKAKEKLYVKFDKNNQPIDVGLSVEASIGIKGTPPIASAGYTLGVNSGFNFSGKSPF